MKIWICLPVFNRLEFTLTFLESLRAQTFQNFTTVICDHGSTDGTTEVLRRLFPEVVIINADSSLWWTGAINRCVVYVLEQADADDALLTINNDTVLPGDYLQNMSANYWKVSDSILTSVIMDIKTGELVSSGYRQNWFLAKAAEIDFSRDHLPDEPEMAEVSFASGRGTLFPIRVFKQLGLYDEKHLPHYLADYDFSFKASRAQYRIYACLNCRVLSHIEETGMVKVLNKFSLKSFVDYFTSIRSPANLTMRWRYGWNNCPKWYLPVYLLLDFVRTSGAYFKKFITIQRS